jgi:hypothetical protein
MNIYNTEIKLYEEKDNDPIHHLLKENYCICSDRKELERCLYSEKVLEQYNDFCIIYELRMSLISDLKNHKECKIFFESAQYEEYNKDLEEYESEVKNYLEKYISK